MPKTNEHICWGWRDIANYLGVSGSTAIRYYRDRGMPVGHVNNRVCAHKRFLELWLVQQNDEPQPKKNYPEQIKLEPPKRARRQVDEIIRQAKKRAREFDFNLQGQ